MIPEEYQGGRIVAVYHSSDGHYYAQIHEPQEVVRDNKKVRDIGDRRVRTFELVNYSFLVKVQRYLEKLESSCPGSFELSDILGED